jgi:hypothetical protein
VAKPRLSRGRPSGTRLAQCSIASETLVLDDETSEEYRQALGTYAADSIAVANRFAERVERQIRSTAIVESDPDPAAEYAGAALCWY